MNNRVIVVLDRDKIHEWAVDPELGTKIRNAALEEAPIADNYGTAGFYGYKDTSQLIAVRGLDVHSLAIAVQSPHTGYTADVISLLKAGAVGVGYRLSPTKASMGWTSANNICN